MSSFASGGRESEPLEVVRASVKQVLSTFIRERVAIDTEYQTEKYQKFFQSGFHQLVLGHLASEISLKAILEYEPEAEGVFWRGESFVSTIAESPYRNLQRVFCAFQHMIIHGRTLGEIESGGGMYFLVAEGACDIYSQPFSIAEKHRHYCMDNLQSNPTNDATALFTRSVNYGLDLCCEDIVCERPHVVFDQLLILTLRRTFLDLWADHKTFEAAEYLLENL